MIIACKQALCMGYSEICFWIARGWVRDLMIIAWITAPFKNMRTLTFKAQPTIVFFATVNQMLGGSSQLRTATKHFCVVWTVLNDLITLHSAVVGSWEKPPIIWLTVAKNTFVCWALNFRVHMIFKGAVSINSTVFCDPDWSIDSCSS